MNKYVGSDFDELQLEREAHRKTWRQLEQVTGLLRSALPHVCHRRDIQDLDTPDGYVYASGLQLLIDNIDAALSQQEDSSAIPPAQDEIKAFEARMVLEAGPSAVDLWIKGNPGSGYSNERVNDYRFGWVACLEWMATRPAQKVSFANTPEQQPEQNNES